MVPVLAALPQPGGFPWFTALSVLVVVAVGAFVARRALAEVARLSRLRTKLAVALAACTVTALALAVLDLVAGGSLGQFRLSAVGAPTGRLFLALLLELGLGARRRGAPRRLEAAPVTRRPGTAPLGLVVLVSGSGSNLQALIDASAEPDAPVPRCSRSGPTATAPAAPSGPSGPASRRSPAGCPTT